jgi:hypothetical protein
MLGVFAEFERGIIRERVNAGLARAKAKGTKLGRRTVKASIEARIHRKRWSPLTGNPGRHGPVRAALLRMQEQLATSLASGSSLLNDGRWPGRGGDCRASPMPPI